MTLEPEALLSKALRTPFLLSPHFGEPWWLLTKVESFTQVSL